MGALCDNDLGSFWGLYGRTNVLWKRYRLCNIKVGRCALLLLRFKALIIVIFR